MSDFDPEASLADAIDIENVDSVLRQCHDGLGLSLDALKDKNHTAVIGRLVEIHNNLCEILGAYKFAMETAHEKHTLAQAVEAEVNRRLGRAGRGARADRRRCRVGFRRAG